jgi:predicted dehydrogenase
MSDPTLVFLGCGAAALAHARTLRSVAPHTPRFYASRSAEKARSFSDSYRGSGWFNSYDGALDDPRVDVAVITTPPFTHLELTLRALRAGKHVIVEKPAFLSTSGFDDVATAAALAHRNVFVAENYFYKPVAIVLRDLLAIRAIGDLKLAWINAMKWQRPAAWRSDPALAGGGPLFEGGVHWINLLANLGPSVESITIDECGSPLTTLTRLRYEGGAVGVLAYSWEMKSRLNGIRLSKLFGTAGTITFESNGIFVSIRGRASRLLLPGLRDITGTRAMWADFIRSMRDQQPARFTFERARVDVALLECAGYQQTVSGLLA